MGDIVKITCASCKEEWQCMTGCGLAHARLQDVISSFPETTAREIAEAVKGELFPAFEFTYDILTCSRCESMVSVPVLRLITDDREYTGLCPVCGEKTERTTDIDVMLCPVCGKAALQEDIIGHWD